MTLVTYRELQQREAERLGDIDRSEWIDGIYRRVNGTLQLEETGQTVSAWQSSELTAYVSRLRTVIASGGRAHAAWDELRLIGVGSLSVEGVGGDRSILKLDMLYVSAGYRGQGIGRKLTELLAQQARLLGATRLYISATPTRCTVDAYLRMGATVLESPDPELLELEPEDIHLGLTLV
jgi:GNAT superfamily N-acetyltransferase